MESHKICRLLIVIFAVLAVMFLLLYQKELNDLTVLSEDFVNAAVENLNDNGIEIENSVIERAIPEMDIYTFTFDDHVNEGRISYISEIFIDEVYSNNVTTAAFDVPEGASIGIYDKDDDTDELARMVFSDIDTSFGIYKDGVQSSGFSEPIRNNAVNEISKKTRTVVESISERLCRASKTKFEISGCSIDSNMEIITVVQMMGGYEIDGAYINFIFEDNELLTVEGNWITTELQKKYHEKLLDGINVLYKLELDSVEKISSQQIIYSLRNVENNRYYLLPAWKISYIDEHGNSVQENFDAL